ncbi:MAG TPA: type IV toxin-antitoxin system AbiEi family antitoxin [Candidatus Binatia bacterium]|uniref:Putative transcriptional regulator n=1 Tax=Candidatus Nitrosotenuis uzonensis TaxID=1407055 RepID=A0A812F3H2_9ARCH|nr:type IV toxin-antitoxin system AbiEi family antitoxin [Candidatus Nitrosotenuis uzonensis]CAE6485650.1 putative transcriptional regulator [Candidatus Nitrosotenuis uzonensis]HWP52423.1 type IV toxin-antitoxin system AbiEi family antitoxin [Candidatus Binatia bacterium]
MVTQNIKLGPQETKLLFSLEEKGVSIFTTEDAKKILDSGSASAWLVISGLKKKGRVRQIEKGKYLLIPAKAGIEGYWAEEAWVVVPYLIDEYYVGFWTAMNFWGMTEQIPNTVFVVTPKRKKKRILKFGNQRYEFVTLSRKKFFGFIEEKTGKTTFNISSKEKTIVDGLMHPQYCGGIPEVTKAMWNARKDVEWKKVLELAERTGINVVLRRLGYLLDVLKIESDISKIIMTSLKRYPYQYLDPDAPKEKIEYSKEYGLIINLTKNELLGWRGH